MLGAGLSLNAGVLLGATRSSTPIPTLSLSPAVTIPEGNSGITTVPTTATVSRNGATGALVVSLTYSGTAQPGVDYQLPLPPSVTVPNGQNSVTFNINIVGDTNNESNETIIITAILAAYPSAAASRTITIGDDDLTAPTGFYMNGSTNPIWSAAVASVVAGNATRFPAMLIGDSTGVGEGGGTDGSAWMGAVANRPVRFMADRLIVAGVAASHQSFHGDAGILFSGSGVNFVQYNPAVNLGGWADNGYNVTPGGSYFTSGSPALAYSTTAARSYRINYFGEGTPSPSLLIDGAAPASVTGPFTVAGTNYIDYVATAATTGAHILSIGGGGVLNGVTAFPATGGVDFITNAWHGATTDAKTATTSNYGSRSFITNIAPAVTVINLGLNDMNSGVAVATFTTNLQTIVTTAKSVGDVLLMFPHPSGGGFNTNVTAFHAAAKQLAIDNTIAFFSLYEFEGGVFTSGDMQDGVVHPKAATYQRYHTATGVALLKMAGL